MNKAKATSAIPRITASPFQHLRMASSPSRVHARASPPLGIEIKYRVRLYLNGQIGAVLSLVDGQLGVVLKGHGNLHDEAIVDDPFRLAGRVSLAAGAGQIQHDHTGS